MDKKIITKLLHYPIWVILCGVATGGMCLLLPMPLIMFGWIGYSSSAISL
jgi:hypothetical protein